MTDRPSNMLSKILCITAFFFICLGLHQFEQKAKSCLGSEAVVSVEWSRGVRIDSCREFGYWFRFDQALTPQEEVSFRQLKKVLAKLRVKHYQLKPKKVLVDTENLFRLRSEKDRLVIGEMIFKQKDALLSVLLTEHLRERDRLSLFQAEILSRLIISRIFKQSPLHDLGSGSFAQLTRRLDQWQSHAARPEAYCQAKGVSLWHLELCSTLRSSKADGPTPWSWLLWAQSSIELSIARLDAQSQLLIETRLASLLRTEGKPAEEILVGRSVTRPQLRSFIADELQMVFKLVGLHFKS